MIQFEEASRLVSEEVGDFDHTRVYQSRSGPPSQPWLEPDVCDYLKELRNHGNVTDVVLVPIGFISDHMEVLFDLDTEARELCNEIGLNLVRAKTVGAHPRFVNMIRELIVERMDGAQKEFVGALGPSHDICPEGCCPSGRPAK